MTPQSFDSDRLRLSRRSALAGIAGVAGAAAVGCSTKAPVSKDQAKQLSNIPDYIPEPTFPGAIKPKAEGGSMGATKYPEPYVTVPDMPPCSGDTISQFTITWGGQVPGKGHNPSWKWLGERVNCVFDPIITPADSYTQKISTILAGGELPDICVLTPSATVNKALKQGAFADLTDVLGGDKIKQWSNIGWTKPDQWKLAAIGGRTMGIPIDVPIANQCVRIRADWAKKLGYSEPPKNAEEFHAFMTEVPKAKLGPGGGKAYGLPTFDGEGGGNGMINSMFKVPNGWREEDGKLVNRFETDEFAAAMEYATKLWKDGGFHPDALALSQQVSKWLSLFNAGQLAIMSISAMGWFQKPYVDVVKAAGGEKAIAPYILPSHDGNGPGVYYLASGVYGWISVAGTLAKDEKKLTEVLNLINYFKAPWASKEYNQRSLGEQGKDWDFDKDGIPVPKGASKYTEDLGALTYGFRNNVWFGSGEISNLAEIVMDYETKAIKCGLKDPAAFIPSAVGDRVSPALGQLASEYLNAIVTGKRPLSDLPQFVTQWKSKGGDQLRDDLQKGLQERNGG